MTLRIICVRTSITLDISDILHLTNIGGYLMEQQLRKKAIEKYLQGEKPKGIYQDLNRSKNWFFKWLKRYQTGDPNWYEDQSKAPKRSPQKLSDIKRQHIIETRKRLEDETFAQIGVSAIKWELSKSGSALPSDSTINRVLKAEGLIKKNTLRCQGSWISIFHRSTWNQQHPPGRSGRSAIHKKRWQILLIQCDGYIQSPCLHRISKNKGGPSHRLQFIAVLEVNGASRFSSNGQWTEFSWQQQVSTIIRNGNKTLSAFWSPAGIHPGFWALEKWCNRKLQRHI